MAKMVLADNLSAVFRTRACRRTHRRLFLLSAAALMVGHVTPAAAQDRADDNAVTQSEDAFGFSVGRESIGIYGPTNARGFSPTAAGNVRIDGLYFDPLFGLPEALVGSTSVKVGLSAQGYPFVAPSGIVDQSLRRPGAAPGASLIVSADDDGGKGVEFDGSLPLSSHFAIFAGLSAANTVFINGTDNFTRSESLIAHWRPSAAIDVMPFWARYDDYGDEAGTLYVPAGSFFPKIDRPHHDESPRWADNRSTGTDSGLLANLSLGANWIVRLGAFESSLFNRNAYTFLLAGERPDGTAERLLIADPKSHNRSLSGELRVTHSIAEGPRLHLIHVSVRRRDARREFGGSDVVDFGPGSVGGRVTAAKPAFDFGDQTRQHVEQMTYGAAYDGRWKGVGEISISLSRADYRKRTEIPGSGRVSARSRPWLYNGTAAIILSKSISLYGGYARGFEESGTAPLAAANRNEPLASILMRQIDGGVRVNLGHDMRAIVGLFDLTRPYFGFDTANVFRQVGSVQSRGAEFSVSGKVSAKLSLVLGGAFLKPRVNAAPDAFGTIGTRPLGVPTHLLNFNANWETPLRGLQLDLGVSHRGRQAATADNLVFLPPHLNVNLGLHYGFVVARKTATFRVQATNLLDSHDVSTFGPGIYGPRGSRQLLGYLTVDL